MLLPALSIRSSHSSAAKLSNMRKETKSQSNIVMGKLSPSEPTRSFLDGSSRSVVELRSAVIGLGTYLPGWRWSRHAGPQTGQPSARHIGYLVSGRMTIRDSSGQELTIGPGEAFEVGRDHDAWVVGDEPCVALDFSPVTDESSR